MCIRDSNNKPKAQLLGARGFPGNTINHSNSMFVPRHDRRSFVEGEVDMVSGVGYNPSRRLKAMREDFINLKIIVSNLAVLDFKGPDHKIRIKSLHPNVSLKEVQDNTGFELVVDSENITETPLPSDKQLSIIREFLDPENLREKALPDRS